MSIRLRLTLWYVFLLAIILIVFSGTLYAILSFSLFNELDRTLERRAAEVQNGATAAFDIQSDPRGFLSRGRLLIPSANTFATPGVYVQVLTPDGTMVSRSENLGDQTLSISADLITRVARSDSVFANTTSSNIPLRLYASPLTLRSQTIGIIVVAESLQPTNDTLAR